jgi:hypothetical protein
MVKYFEIEYLSEAMEFINSLEIGVHLDVKRRAFVICTHGIIKKTDKTPQKEIDKAENIRKQYLEHYGK